MRGIFVSDVTDVLHLPKGSERKISHFAIDSRKIEEGGLFFALPGDQVDGHHFLAQARDNGAIAAVVSKLYRGASYGLELIPTLDVTLSLQLLAKEFLSRKFVTIVAVTGSMGKTTTKDYLATLLREKWRIGKTYESYNGQLGLPISILNGTGAEEVWVLEMGMNQVGEMDRLVEIAPPDLSIVTAIGHSHAQFFSDGMEGIAREKGKIFSHPKTRLGIISDHCPNSLMAHAKCKINTLSSYAPFPSFPMEEIHLQQSLRLASAAARELGMSDHDLQKGYCNIRSSKSRFEKVEKEGILFIDDSYNASFESVMAALQALPKVKGKRVAVLGSMKELGELSELLHERVGQSAFEQVDEVICLGEECAPIVDRFMKGNKAAALAKNFEEAQMLVEKSAAPGDVVLVKGANSHKLWNIISDFVGKK